MPKALRTEDTPRESPETLSGGDALQAAREKAQEDVLDLARKGDASNVEELILSCYPQVSGLAWRLTHGDAEAAKDLTQESFYRALRSLDSFRGQSAFSTWMFRIVVNTWSSTQRRRKLLRSLLAPAQRLKRREVPDRHSPEDCPCNDSFDPAKACSRQDFKAAFLKVLESLPQKQQLVFSLKALQELSIPEISEVTGLAEGTVKTHLFRATGKLRNKLEDWIDL